MILIGQFDSPFVRRVAVSADLLGIGFEHRPWSTFSDADRIRPLSPLLRVPVVVTAGGLALTDSGAILDWLDGQVPPERRLVPAAEPLRHRVLRVLALWSGVADKAVWLFYETRLHAAPAECFAARVRGQIADTLALLQAERAAAPGPAWFGDTPGQADITAACVWRFLAEAHPGLADAAACPALAADAAAFEATGAARRRSQPFIPPP